MILSGLIVLLLAIRCLHAEQDLQSSGSLAGARTPDMQLMYEDMCLNPKLMDSNNQTQSVVKNQCMCGMLQDLKPITTMNLVSIAREIPCVNGLAAAGDDTYPCSNVDLLSRVSLAELNSIHGSPDDRANDVWGWTAPSGQEIAIIGMVSGAAFVDVTDPVNYKYLGKLPTKTVNSLWRDIKTYRNYAFIVSEAKGHGMQVIDLSQMVGMTNAPVVFKSRRMRGFGHAHNIHIHEATGYAYIVGSNKCNGGLFMVNIQNPLAPFFEGCYADDGYTHDVHCVLYYGADTRYTGREICFACNVDTVSIIDVTDKSSPILLSRTGYTDVGYTHQGWLTDDHNTFIFGDEFDERTRGITTRTLVMNVRDLVTPTYVGSYSSSAHAIDHNQYVKDRFTFQANYNAGLRILEIFDVKNQVDLREVAYFDVYPEDDAAIFNGAWSNYPYFASGTVVVSSIDRGLFVLRPHLNPASSKAQECLSTGQRCSISMDFVLGYQMNQPQASGLPCNKQCVREAFVGTKVQEGWECGWSC